jgi:hypothetical protein
MRIPLRPPWRYRVEAVRKAGMVRPSEARGVSGEPSTERPALPHWSSVRRFGIENALPNIFQPLEKQTKKFRTLETVRRPAHSAGCTG